MASVRLVSFFACYILMTVATLVYVTPPLSTVAHSHAYSSKASHCCSKPIYTGHWIDVNTSNQSCEQVWPDTYAAKHLLRVHVATRGPPRALENNSHKRAEHYIMLSSKGSRDGPWTTFTYFKLNLNQGGNNVV